MKKFLEKNPMIHFTSVLTIIAIACGLIIGLINLATADTIEANQEAKAKEAYSTLLFEVSYGDAYNAWAEDYVAPELNGFQVFWNKLTQEPTEGVPSIEEWQDLEGIAFDINDYSFTNQLSSDDPDTILAKEEVTDADGKLVGYIFQAVGTNGYGDMTMVVLVGADGTILNATFQTLNQTLNLDRTRANLQLFVGTKIASLTPSGDLQSGATYSRTTMIDLLSDIATSFASVEGPVVEVDPYVAMFGEGFTLANDDTFVGNDYVVARQIASDADGVEVGYLYQVTGQGIYNSGDQTQASITLYVGLDSQNNILGIDAPKDEYHHTPADALYGNVVSYLDSLAGTNLSAFDSSADLTSGATNSKTLVNSLLDQLKGVVIPG